MENKTSEMVAIQKIIRALIDNNNKYSNVAVDIATGCLESAISELQNDIVDDKNTYYRLDIGGCEGPWVSEDGLYTGLIGLKGWSEDEESFTIKISSKEMTFGEYSNLPAWNGY